MSSIVVSLFHSLRFLVRSRASLHLEIVALRHQLAVVNRSRRPRLRFTTVDRVLWAWLSQRWHGWRAALHVVQPATVLAWHQPRLSPVLGMEGPTSRRAAGRASRCPRVDSRDVHDEPVVGRTSDSRRAPEVGHLGESVDRRQIHAAAATTTVANVADLPHQSREPDHGGGSVRGAHGHLSAALCPRDPRPRPSTDRPCRGHRSSDRGLDGSTASQCLFRERRTGVSTPRSRFSFCRRGDHSLPE